MFSKTNSQALVGLRKGSQFIYLQLLVVIGMVGIGMNHS